MKSILLNFQGMSRFIFEGRKFYIFQFYHDDAFITHLIKSHLHVRNSFFGQ